MIDARHTGDWMGMTCHCAWGGRRPNGHDASVVVTLWWPNNPVTFPACHRLARECGEGSQWMTGAPESVEIVGL